VKEFYAEMLLKVRIGKIYFDCKVFILIKQAGGRLLYVQNIADQSGIHQQRDFHF